jgi:Nif-specific regulatory protein
MKSRLVAIAGPLKVGIFELNDGAFSVGRELNNNLVINDLSVSRQHCVIHKENDRYRIVDLSSHNRTFVNDQPAGEQPLAHGDRIAVGNSVFVFLHDMNSRLNSSSEVLLEGGVLLTKTAVKIRIEDALNLVARDLDTLMRISMKINSLQEPDAIQGEILDRIFDVVPAERGAILLTGDGPDEFSSMFGRERYEASKQTIRVSRTIVQQVLREKLAILSNNVLKSDEFGSAQSLISSQIQSLLCVPLTLLDRTLGVIYLDTKDPDLRFDRGQLQMVTALANISAGVLANVQRLEGLKNENLRLKTALNLEHDIIGRSPCMAEVLQLITKVASTDLTVLITGESGTGKELVARAIHKNSVRKDKPFVAINCSALPETLLESELFGHEKGAFTQAYAQKKGLLETAQGGTIFLDEIGEMSIAAQVKLLRVLQEREFVRVGGTSPVKIDVRLVTATNKNLEEAIAAGEFRQDLYFRLNVFPLALPPLRNRREDILLLAKHFINKHGKKYGRDMVGISPEARAMLINHHWPGNVRELENAVEAAVALSATGYMLPEDLPGALRASTEKESEEAPACRTYQEAVKEAKKRLILNALEQTEGDHAGAARLLGIHPNNLHRLIRTLELKRR